MQGNIVRNNWSASLVAAIFSIPMASAQPVQAQAPTQQGGPAASSPDGTLRFEAVSVKLSAPSANAPVRQVRNIDPGRLRYVNIGLKDLVLEAYNLKAYQVVGPDWLGEIALDIDATMRPGLTKRTATNDVREHACRPVQADVPLGRQGAPCLLDCYRQFRTQDEGSIEVPPSENTSGIGAPPAGLDGPVKLDTDGFPIFPGPQRDGAGTVMINGRW